MYNCIFALISTIICIIINYHEYNDAQQINRINQRDGFSACCLVDHIELK